VAVNQNTSGKRTRSAAGEQAPSGAHRGYVLIVEPDPLTQWSLKTYLGKWFTVESTGSVDNAERILEKQPVDALIVSDELPPSDLAALEQRAHSFNARVAIVRTITDAGKALFTAPHLNCLEKPFELARLAGLLGVTDGELPPPPTDGTLRPGG
jgi:DNA-binding NtrC family response regulator